MSMYEAYKDSGAEWLGEIPANWKTGVIGSLYTLRNTKVSDADYPPLSVTMRGVVPQLESAAKTDDHDARKLVLKGDFAINSRSDRRGSCGISDYDGSVSLINTVLTPRGVMNPRYYNWLFHTVQFADEYYKNGCGIVDDLWTTRWNEMKRILIPVPSDVEQAAIAEYLNSKIAAIDAIVAEAKASIEEYKAWKTALVNDAVTHGVERNAPCEDSGIYWIGHMPKHWGIKRLKYMFAIKKDIAGEAGHTILAITQQGVKPKNMADKGQFAADYSNYQLVCTGDFAMNHMDLLTGWVDISAHDGVTSPDYRVFYALSPNEICKDYYKHVFQNCYRCRIFYGLGHGVSGFGRWRLPADMFLNFVLPVPPLKEQQEIAEYLNTQCAQIDDLIAEKEALVADLEAYKKSLIFEVVTGKRKVV